MKLRNNKALTILSAVLLAFALNMSFFQCNVLAVETETEKTESANGDTVLSGEKDEEDLDEGQKTVNGQDAASENTDDSISTAADDDDRAMSDGENMEADTEKTVSEAPLDSDADMSENENEKPEETPFFMKDPATGIIVEAEAGVVPAGTMAVMIPVEGMEEAEQLGQFLSLSADRYTAYYISLIDFMTMSPILPSGELKITIPIPEDYDSSRVVVSNVTLNGETPLREELEVQFVEGTAVFTTAQPGLFAVMEKKIMPELPEKLEMTDKVEQLQLVPGYQNMNSSFRYTSNLSAGYSSPQTGDETHAGVWVLLAVAAAGAVIVVIVMRNRKH